jgi:hypothetical protein
MDQLGHTDPGFTLRIYRHGMRRGVARERLRALVGADARTIGSGDTDAPDLAVLPSPILLAASEVRTSAIRRVPL